MTIKETVDKLCSHEISKNEAVEILNAIMDKYVNNEQNQSMTNPLYLHFGKYTGVHLSMIPIDYLRYISKSKALKKEQREFINKIL